MMITDQEIENINNVFNSLHYREREAIQQKAMASGLFLVKKTAHTDEHGRQYVSKSYTRNTGLDDELWYRTFVMCMTDVMVRRYINVKGK